MRLIAITGLAALLAPVGALAAPIEWAQQDIDAAIQAAATCDGHVLVDVYATWCGPCHRLDAEVFPDPIVQRAADGMIAVKVDAEVGAGPQIAERYHVVGYPTVLVLDAQGVEIDRIFGFHPADEFAAQLHEIRFGPDTLSDALERFRRAASARTVVATAFDMGYHAAACGRYDVADTLLRGVVDADADNADGMASAALLALGKYRHLRGAGEYDTAIGVFTELRQRYPASPEAAEALVQAGIAHARAGRPDSALAAFRFFLADDPADSNRANAVAFAMLQEEMDLEVATEIARAGLAVEPRDHSLWDTLAELRFAAGDRAGALEAADRALALEPASPYYARQRDRFAAP